MLPRPYRPIYKAHVVASVIVLCAGLPLLCFLQATGGGMQRQQVVTPKALTPSNALTLALPIGRIFFISYVDEGRKLASGSVLGAQSRQCYAQMHANYTAIQYTDQHFQGWTPTSTNTNTLYNPEADAHHRARYYSKLIFVNRTFHEQNMTEHDWVFWMDSDTIITNPAIQAETIIREACVDHRRQDSHSAFNEPASVKLRDMIVANTHNGLNNGVYAMRNTAWSRRFLQRWWDDGFGSTDHAFDNGPFMHAVLREMVDGAGRAPDYDGACDGRIHPTSIMGGWEPFWACYRRVLTHTVCNDDDRFDCMSRCPVDDVVGAEAVWRGSTDNLVQNPSDSVTASNGSFTFGSIIEGDDHIGGHCHINAGIGWGPTSDWRSNSSWLLHLAGHSTEDRKRILSQVSKRVSTRFSPQCAFTLA